jgi:hypothetical protein
MTDSSDLMQDETTITEITIQPDGRVFIFGTSRQVLDILIELEPRSARLNRLLGHVRSLESDGGTTIEPVIASTERRD